MLKVNWLKSIILIVVALFSLFSCKESGKEKAIKKFKESDNTAVFTTKFITEDKKEITTIIHDEDDGAWQFLSNDEFDDFTKVVKLVSLKQIVTIDNSVLEVSDMPIGYSAHRESKEQKWIIAKK